jgi:enamine deaminase RidA (YjgF/YER057c/UK114 family)
VRAVNIARGTIMSAEARLKQLGIALPEVPAPVANYLPYRVAGNLLFLAGQGPRGADGRMLTGKVGAEVSVEEAYQRARIIGLQLLSAMRRATGSLDRVDCVLKMLVMVNAVPDFKDHPKVANGMSDLFVEVFGDAGKHARSAVGMGSLPNQISVEIEGVVAIKA